ncbi:hypothetical protein QNH46_02545 [Paenibacillus woosongensis]|uniref:Uncharacterized protein n=1 Tax=Paenibacillus woosongensis TaxID=307580 RepID=A0AA95L201_9BACL|nr:hypothetical protein [Paenibacillus woosongensis]WHX49586.1 hypothetical protein QNH46_02545 [Paenibacillus woosongensis]
MEIIEKIQKIIEDDDCEYSDGCLSAYFDFIEVPINDSMQNDLRAFYDQEAKSWLSTLQNVNYFKLSEIINWKVQLKSELREFFYLNEYSRQPEEYKEQIEMILFIRDQTIEELISLIEKLLHKQEYDVFEIDIRLDRYYAIYSKDYAFRTERNYYLLRAQIHD